MNCEALSCQGSYLLGHGQHENERARARVCGKGGGGDTHRLRESGSDKRAAVAKQCTYDLDAPAVPEGKDPVDYFLFDSKRGYCDLFASAMTVLARTIHLPARFVIGYANFTNARPDANGSIAFCDTDFHAWSEIYFKETGWTIFDATDGAAEAPGAGRGQKQGDGPWYEKTSVIFGLGVITLFSVLALLLRLSKKFRGIVSVRKEKKAELERQYVELVRKLESRTGRPRRPSQTPAEYLATVEPFLDGTFESVRLATESFVSSFYGSSEPTQEQITELKRLVTDAKLKLKSIKRRKDAPAETES